MTYNDIITDIITRYPDLDTAGFDRLERNSSSDWSIHEGAFWAALDYVKSLRVLTVYPAHPSTSYGFKHDVEELVRDLNDYVYCPNGVFIAALICAKIPFRRADINAVPRVSRGSRYTRYDRRGRFRIPPMPAMVAFRKIRADVDDLHRRIDPTSLIKTT
ncbi:hypothetical protein PX699_00260 [Sphingobium sp. H39-3-25]|uniref:hypothetical protein n=1 Tax=Sphingobium arseniciresistens TaxID=3030834 RepID=UPI0023B894E1|nr:hypothetical protein [Sphingobium arseniciresistens]